ncbi:MAG: sulfite exporter TauE/SafE family protein [Deltaproteobacteria bacterium]|nr:sulfite exporter TauE/SafE family protein [Deltaproteobacteria bacterium]
MVNAGLFLLGIFSGTVSGFLGIGGAIIIIPALIYFFKMTQYQAQGTSLAVLLPPIGLVAFWEYYKNGHVELKIAFIIAIGFLFGGFMGAYAVQYISGGILKRIFGVFLLIIAVDMIMD